MAGKKKATLPRAVYELELQEWVRTEDARLVVVFEGRDSAGKGGTVERVSEHLNPQVARTVALPRPPSGSARSGTSNGMPSICPPPGEFVLFERMLVEEGILLRKYWFSVSDAVQQERFRRRLEDPTRRWKLSPMDLESITRWEAYSRAMDEMLVHTDVAEAPGTSWRATTSAGPD